VEHENVAMSRLNGLLFKSFKNEEKLIEYDNGIKELLKNEIAEKVPGNSSNVVYYIPHRPVYREEKTTTKMRIVFDASSSEPPSGSSLNEYLSPGENLLLDLMSILIKFRSNEIGIVADIEKAFLQISMDEKDRDTHRFLWFDKLPRHNEEIPETTEYRMARVTFGVSCSPFLLTATIQNHLTDSELIHGEICEKQKMFLCRRFGLHCV